MKNSLLISEFERLVKQINYDIDHEKDMKKKKVNMFRLKQIGNALNIIKKYDGEIKSGEQLKDIKGIGTGIINRINEILKTGSLSEITLQSTDIKNAQYIEDLKEVYGIGESKASELVNKYKIKTVDELRDAYIAGNLKLNSNVVMGLKYHGIYKQQIPRAEMKKMDKYLHNMVLQINSKLELRICGSYRREKPFSNDIDCMLAHPKIVTQNDLKNKKNYLHKFIELLKEDLFIVDALTSEDVETKFMGFCQYSKKLPIRRIDIRYVPYESYYSSLLYFTGSGPFNQKMRQDAKKMGYKLNEYGLFKKINGKIKNKTKEEFKLVKVTSEEDIFEKLGMPYVKPKDRI